MTPDSPPPGPLARLFAAIAGALLLVLGFMFSVVLLAVLAVLGLAAWGYFWWKTRALRQAVRERAQQPADGAIIEGEAVVVEEYRVGTTGVLPREPGGK